ncbi:MAG TPA: imidazole glycerol phosphate synthase subunit HisH [Sphingorhabdus sp.]|jgi:glutamine amidotransferase|uniref:imidazole glycerol phosphate synthase subunit HisH n=1 Tax=Sphingorhabdus sp. TaxID=1902408 RepID=UPI002B784B17|nr:imidazole glycerol phosphate synthase subunit HisH [Sphingorhabdus sp.]HMT42393.1 imidazole glycerol phosphate synthase subunit HisH [Sphingorhabdus sp.]HMU20720.1 imidazole glycerol phosphate synthase subunit HisH [Sphingorhabdus sp.]
MAAKVTIVDYGMCNLLNVARAFTHVGVDVDVTENPATAATAERLVVPGVGAFEDSVKAVREKGFDDAIRRFQSGGRPFLGICVGMQMLFDASEEFGEHAGLGILAGRVKAVPALKTDGETQRVPHIGWNGLTAPETDRSWNGTLLETTPVNSAVYFVHSFAAVPNDPNVRLADCVYGGHRICAAVQHENVMATQFHPERSGELGLDVLRRFMQM